MTYTGRLFSFEGGEGSGKTTLARALAARLQMEGVEPVLVREPGGTPTSEKIRGVLLDPENPMDGLTELLLFEAARSDLTYRVIRPALESGRIVIADRLMDSTTAYQGGGRFAGDAAKMNLIARLNEEALYGIVPDRTFYLRIAQEQGFTRAVLAGRSLDRIEQAGTEFHRRVEAVFEQLAIQHPQRILSIDATLPLQTVLDDWVWPEVQFVLGQTQTKY